MKKYRLFVLSSIFIILTLCSCAGEPKNDVTSEAENSMTLENNSADYILNQDTSFNHLLGYVPDDSSNYIINADYICKIGENYYMSIKKGEQNYVIASNDEGYRVITKSRAYCLTAHNDKLYWIETRKKGQRDYESFVVCSDLNGTEQRLVCELGSANGSYRKAMFYDGNVYISDTAGNITAVDLNTQDKKTVFTMKPGEHLLQLTCLGDCILLTTETTAETNSGIRCIVYSYYPEADQLTTFWEWQDVILDGKNTEYKGYSLQSISSKGAYVVIGNTLAETNSDEFGRGFKTLAKNDLGSVYYLDFNKNTLTLISELGQIIEQDGLYRYSGTALESGYFSICFDDDYNYFMLFKDYSDTQAKKILLGKHDKVSFNNDYGLNPNITVIGYDKDFAYCCAQYVMMENSGNMIFGEAPIKYTVIYALPIGSDQVFIIYSDKE